ncbi:putative membrane protein [Lederbergia galactosidilyticus]|nr:putative membrane protein [Lederbergia galactosidilytica]
MTKNTPVTAVKESRRLLEAIGWAVVLPQLLATLGMIFTQAGVGTVVADLITKMIPENNLFMIVFVFCMGMAIFTIIMGNAFAAFPVMAAGIALPFLIHQFHADPNHIAAISMFAGYCGTLMTPMAANFNIVPAALLDLKDKNHVIRIQIPTALCVLAFNIVLMYFLIKWEV